MKASELKNRTRYFAVAILKLSERIPDNDQTASIKTPLIRCGVAVGAAYRRTCLSRNQLDFASRIGVAEEAADECAYWLELLAESKLLSQETVQPLLDEVHKLGCIFRKSRKSAARRFRQGLSGLSPLDEGDIPF